MEGSVKEQILREATRRFAEHGFDGTSLQDIADSVGIRKPSLLYHYPSKDDLRREVLDGALSRWNDVLPRVLMAAARDERLDAVLTELITFFADDPDRARLLVREILDRPDDMRDRLRTFVRPWLQVVARQMDRAKEQGLIHHDVDPEAYPALVINLVVCGIAMAETAGTMVPSGTGDRSDHKRLLREMFRIARASLYLPQASTTKAGESSA
ncbi:MAG: TetR/AcrR family transcriptional regulator [Myxococcota bacterium]